MENLQVKLRLLQAKLKAQQVFSLNTSMQVQSNITLAEIEELNIIIEERKKKEDTSTQVDNDAVLLPVGLLTLVHDINMNVIGSTIPEKTCCDFADVINAVLTKHNLLSKYQEYVKKRFGGLPPNGL